MAKKEQQEKERITHELVFKRSTKNKHLYEGAEGDALGSVYVDKTALPDPAPSGVTVTISWPV